MSKLILLRHGQSAWNKVNIFTGWVDIPLSQEGIAESLAAGKQIAKYSVDVVYSSSLVRSIMTACLSFAQTKQVLCLQHGREPRYQVGSEGRGLVPLYIVEEFNERMYGDLQGKNKEEIRLEYGNERVQSWRRSFTEVPPGGESLQMTAQRTLPAFQKLVIPRLQSGETVCICAHGNSLRSIVMDIESLSKDAVVQLEIPTGEVRVYEYLQGIFTRYE